MLRIGNRLPGMPLLHPVHARIGRVTQKCFIPAVVPAIVMVNPKFPPNVARAQRNAAAYGVEQVWFTGSRVALDGRKLPREERLRGYQGVTLANHEDPISCLLESNPGAVPVAIEVRPGSECLFDFVHPEKAIYVFGPEDGSLEGPVLKRCHRFAILPTAHCLNLADTIATVLYDRNLKTNRRFDVGESEGRRDRRDR